MSEENSTAIGKKMMFIAWIIGLALLTQLFGDWEGKQVNPNQNPQGLSHQDGRKELTLKQNRWGHYLVNGTINDKAATFLLDTGATDVVIPSALADTYNLDTWGSVSVQTANGIVKAQNTVIPSLSIGNITLYNVRASVNPGMDKGQEVLLGMSALRQLELTQKGDTLTLVQPY